MYILDVYDHVLNGRVATLLALVCYNKKGFVCPLGPLYETVL